MINPFKSVLFITFVKEREKAKSVASTGGVCANEQLVWVLWKILKGDGNDVSCCDVPSCSTLMSRNRLDLILRALWHGRHCRPSLEQLI